MSLSFYVFPETCDNYKLSKRVRWGQTPTAPSAPFKIHLNKLRANRVNYRNVVLIH